VTRPWLYATTSASPNRLTFRDLITHLGANPQIELDEFGILGRMLPSGEFQVTIPALGDLLLPIPFFCDTPLLEENSSGIDDEDGPILRRGAVIRLKDIFSTPLSVVTAESLSQTIQFDELRYEQERDAECTDLFNQRGKFSTIDINDDGLLVRKAPLDGVEQIVNLLSLRGRLLHLEH
jgi:hypothetical protein